MTVNKYTTNEILKDAFTDGILIPFVNGNIGLFYDGKERYVLSPQVQEEGYSSQCKVYRVNTINEESIKLTLVESFFNNAPFSESSAIRGICRGSTVDTYNRIYEDIDFSIEVYKFFNDMINNIQ